jgi:hypothetical protein
MSELLGGGRSAPPPAPPVIPPPAPVRDDVAGTAASERTRLAAQRGRRATMLGGPGAYAAAPSGQRVLLGVSD